MGLMSGLFLLSFLVQQSSASFGLQGLDVAAETATAKAARVPHHDSVDVVHGHDHAASYDPVHIPASTLPVAIVCVGGLLLLIYGPRGTRVVLSVFVYVTALSSMKLSVKWVFVTYAFPYAKFVTALHFIVGALVTGVILFERGQVPVPTAREFWLTIVPIAMSVAASIAAGNIALTLVTAAFTEIIGATTCLITIFLVIAMGMPFNKWLLGPALVVTLGCSLGAKGEINFSLLGVIACLASGVFRSMKVVLQQKLMTGEAKDKFDPCALLFWIALPSSVAMMAASLLTEGVAPYQSLASAGPQLAGLTFAILTSCVNATILNMAQLFVTRDLGAVGGQLVAQAKMILTVLGGMVLFGEEMSVLEIFGFTLALVGVFAFSRIEQAGKESLDAEKQKLELKAGKTYQSA